MLGEFCSLTGEQQKAMCQNKKKHTGLYFQESLNLWENLHII